MAIALLYVHTYCMLTYHHGSLPFVEGIPLHFWKLKSLLSRFPVVSVLLAVFRRRHGATRVTSPDGLRSESDDSGE